MNFETVLYQVDGRVGIVKLNRPSAANGFNLQMTQELAAVAAAIDADPTIKAVIIAAEGRFFSAGGDLKAMQGDDINPAAYIKEVADNLHRAISIFDRMSAPVIIAVNGVAAGAGFSLAATGDLAIASKSASFTMAYTRAGLSPDGSSSYYLPRLIGIRKAKELMLTNRTLSADEAKEWGLLNEVVDDDQLMTRALEIAKSFAAGAGLSNATVKRLLTGTFKNGLEEQMELESRAIADCIRSADGQEGIAAFAEKRKPEFQ